jgi:CHAT domain-containing protein
MSLALRTALRDRTVHVLHFVGHGDLTSSGLGVLYLQGDRRGPVVVDERVLANLVADRLHSLRLVVLNSCKSGRSTREDPQAGVAATLMSLGLPAVVAMQRAISDRAAITFAGDAYTGLIDRRHALDAAVGEARKAVYTDFSSTEWATPVLFVRDPVVGPSVFRAVRNDRPAPRNRRLWACDSPPPSPTRTAGMSLAVSKSR